MSTVFSNFFKKFKKSLNYVIFTHDLLKTSYFCRFLVLTPYIVASFTPSKQYIIYAYARTRASYTLLFCCSILITNVLPPVKFILISFPIKQTSHSKKSFISSPISSVKLFSFIIGFPPFCIFFRYIAILLYHSLFRWRN